MVRQEGHEVGPGCRPGGFPLQWLELSQLLETGWDVTALIRQHWHLEFTLLEATRAKRWFCYPHFRTRKLLGWEGTRALAFQQCDLGSNPALKLLRQDGKCHAFIGFHMEIKGIISHEAVGDTECGHQHCTEWCPAEQRSNCPGVLPSHSTLLPQKPLPKPWELSNC